MILDGFCDRPGFRPMGLGKCTTTVRDAMPDAFPGTGDAPLDLMRSPSIVVKLITQHFYAVP